MNDWTADQVQQIQIILAQEMSGKANNYRWAQKKLGRVVNENNDATYDELFDVTEEDIYQYVKLYGWDQRTVQMVEVLPDPKQVGFAWLMLPFKDGRWGLAQFASYDRNLWDNWDFASEDERTRFIIQELIATQRGFWGPVTYGYPPLYPGGPNVLVEQPRKDKRSLLTRVQDWLKLAL